jgi:HD superfamily phosphohydrolase
MASSELLPRIKVFAEELADRSLAPYLARLKRPGEIGLDAKEINDAVWGTVKVSPLEVVVIDSPLVQRMRLVRQLGVVHWVYPGASHSRFEHTLGVLHQSQRIIAAINQSFSGREPPPIDARLEQLVRLCAVAHDIGHGVFSHVSEHALARRTDLILALEEFRHEKGVDKVQLSELVAHDLVGSPSFKQMLELAFDRIPHPQQYDGGSAGVATAIAALIQRAIIGLRIDDRVPLLHEIITGPFDADKLDYYVRDAQHAGVPSVVDVSRLLQKIVHRRTPMQDVPDHIKRSLPEGQDACELFGLKSSGAPMLDELHLARVLLYAKIYRQKKVLAIEAMVDALFGALGSLKGVDPVRLIELCYRFSDDQLLVSSADEVLKVVGARDPPAAVAAFVDDILGRLRDRNLYKNSLALLPKYPDDPWADDTRQKRGLTDLADDCGNAQKAAEFQKAVADELLRLAAALPEAVQAVVPGTLELGVVISSKKKVSGGTEIDRALILQGNRFIHGRDMPRMNQSAWTETYNFNQPHSHVFAPKEAAVAAYVASEKVILSRYDVVLPQSALSLSKQDEGAVTALKTKLEAVGWYSGVSLDIRPKPLRLTRADVADRVKAVALRLAAIDEPIGESPPRHAHATVERVMSWLAQFRDNDAIDGALDAIERIRILSREDSRAALLAFAKDHPEFVGATVVPFGEPKDSGALQGYYSHDVQAVFPRVATITDALATDDGKPIVFVDDFIGTGKQARDMLGNWFDDGDLRQGELGEARVTLSESERASLRGRPVAFAFVTGWSEGLKAVEEAARSVGMDATVVAHLPESEIPLAFDGTDRSHSSLAFEQASRRIGESLLASRGASVEKQQQRALGYGNRGMLLATRVNVPSQTLAVIWMEGKHDEVDWHPLVKRRDKH